MLTARSAKLLPWCLVSALAVTLAAKSLASTDTPSADAQPTGYLETDLLSDLADGTLDEYSLLDAGLVLGGLQHQADLSHYRHQMSEHIVAACRVVMHHEEHEQQLSVLLDYLHGEILTDVYVDDCNDLRAAIDDGRYNCVTATILYCHLAQHCGLHVQPISLPGHVRVRSTVGAHIEVEPTCPQWFQRGGHVLELTAEHETSETGRPLSYVQLLAKLYYNRGLSRLRNGDHAGALAATELSWQLDPAHERARDNVTTVMNNWALEMCHMHEYETALQLLERGRQIAGDHPLLHANERHIRQLWLHHQAQHPGDSEGPTSPSEAARHSRSPTLSLRLTP